MLKKLTHIILLLTLLFPSIGFSQDVINGVCDLRNEQPDKAYLLKGNWEFYWNELLSPNDFNKTPTKDNYIKVNGDWNNYKYNNKPIGAYGYGTYRMYIIVPAGAYTIQFHQVLTAYKVWIDGKMVSEIGKVGTDRQSSTPKLSINEINFVSTTDTIELIVQVSNFYHGAGGLQEKIYFGKTNAIQQRTTKNLLIAFFSIGAELIFALYFLFLFFFRQKDLAYLFLSLTIFVFIGFELVNSEMILIRYLPGISWDLAKKIDFFSNYSRLFFYSLFAWYSFREYKIMSKAVTIFFIVFSSILSLIVIFTPSYIFSKTLMPFMAVGLPAFLYLLFVTIKGLIKRVPYIIYSFIGMLALNVSALNDVFYNLNIINTGYWASYGLLILFIGNSIMISLKYSKTSNRVERLQRKYKIYSEIQNKLLNIQSFNLNDALSIVNEYVKSEKLELLFIDKDISYCECIKNNNSIICGNNEKRFKYSISENDIYTIIQEKTNIVKKDTLILPVITNNILKAIIYLSFNEKRQLKNITELFEMLLPQISTFIDNYSFYWNLENLNQNLEEIIEARTKLAFKQKKEIEIKNTELDEKIEELNISSIVIKDLNGELKEQRELINEKNEQLDVLKTKIFNQKEILEEKQNNVHSSIRYAKKIQKALLSSYQNFPFNDFFILNQPQDIVSGDLFLSIKSENNWIIGAIDTTGRNVSATFLSFLLKSLFNESIDEQPDLIKSPAELIKTVKTKYIENLKLDTGNNINDSFDISLCSINLNTGYLKFSGANQNVVVIRNNDTIILEGDKFSIGGYIQNEIEDIKTQEIDLKYNDKIYLFTDGYHKQIGQNTKRKFGIDNLISLLQQTSKLNINKQKEKLLEKHQEWKGNIRQVDDILIIGIKFSKQKQA